jgi:hypothetical protein
VKSLLRWNGIETNQDCESPQRVTERQYYKEGSFNSVSKDTKLWVYPNPSNERLTIALKGKPTAEALFFLCNSQGQPYFIQNLSLATNEATISTADMPSGLYFIKVQLKEGFSFQSKVSIQH